MDNNRREQVIQIQDSTKKYIKRVQEIYEKADSDIINSPIVLEALCVTIINYVDTKKTYKDFFNIDVNEDGTIVFTHYKDNENKNKNKFAGTRTYSKEKIGDKIYIEMSGMFGVLKDNKTQFGNTELETQYIKSFNATFFKHFLFIFTNINISHFWCK